MPSSDDRCPTCDGSGFVARNDQRYPCPTCSPTGDVSGPCLAAVPDESSALSIARSAAHGLGLAALIAAMVMVLICENGRYMKHIATMQNLLLGHGSVPHVET